MGRKSQGPGSSPQRTMKWVLQYGGVLLAVAVIVLVRWLLDPILQEHHPFVLFLAPVLLAAWNGGWKPGAFALVVGCLTADFFFVHPRFGFGFRDVEHIVGRVFFVVIGTVAILLSESVRSARRRAEKQADLLRTEIAEHERTQEQLRQAQDHLERTVEQRTTELAETSSHLREEEAARRKAEARSRRLTNLVAWSEDAIVGLDLNCVVTDWNIGAEHLFGIPAVEIIGQSIFMLVPPDDREETLQRVERLQQGKHPEPYEAIRLRKDGSRVAVSVRASQMKDDQGHTVGFSLIYRDLSATKKLEEQLRQAQKMEAVGQLAGGVAHDFNNLLTVINGYSELILTGLKPNDPQRNLLQQIHDAGGRAASLTHQLLAFSRKQVLQPQVMDLNETVRHSEKMLRRLIGEDVRLTSVLGPNLGSVKIDAGQMEQVIINLAVNARDAMPQGGKLTIETANVELDEAYAEMHPEVWTGRYVLLAVTDTGTGMEEDTKARIFEPFFTTKEVGRGTGLGLAVVHGIVKQSGGHIAVYSELGQGTTFKIYLPAIEGLRRIRKSHQGLATAPKGAETILLVEDEEAVRALAKRALQMSGYTVLEAGHGGEAVRMAEKYEGPIHLLVSDVIMPEMGGRLLSDRLSVSRPDIKVLFVSGYTDDAVVRHGVLEADMDFLQKPFTPGALAKKVRDVLDVRG